MTEETETNFGSALSSGGRCLFLQGSGLASFSLPSSDDRTLPVGFSGPARSAYSALSGFSSPLAAPIDLQASN